MSLEEMQARKRLNDFKAWRQSVEKVLPESPLSTTFADHESVLESAANAAKDGLFHIWPPR